MKQTCVSHLQCKSVSHSESCVCVCVCVLNQDIQLIRKDGKEGKKKMYLEVTKKEDQKNPCVISM